MNLESVEIIYRAAKGRFGASSVRHDPYSSEAEPEDFPVYLRSGSIASSLALSPTLRRAPGFAVDYVFVDPVVKEKAVTWLDKNKADLLKISKAKKKRTVRGD